MLHEQNLRLSKSLWIDEDLQDGVFELIKIYKMESLMLNVRNMKLAWSGYHAFQMTPKVMLMNFRIWFFFLNSSGETLVNTSFRYLECLTVCPKIWVAWLAYLYLNFNRYFFAALVIMGLIYQVKYAGSISVWISFKQKLIRHI